MKLQLFSGNSNRPLAEAIASNLGTELGDLYLKSFPSGESYCQFKDNIRDGDVFLIQGITFPANENLMSLLIMADAARRASAGRITAVIPYFGYARQDRKEKSRVPISAKLVMDILQAAGIQRIVTMDLHAPQIGGFTNLPFDHLTFEPVLMAHLQKYPKQEIVILAPDVGAVKRAEKYARYLGCDMAFISKRRVSDTQVEASNFVGDVKGKIVIALDDLTESLGTLTQACEVAKAHGAKEAIAAVTHCCLTPDGYKRWTENTVLNDFVHSDTVLSQQAGTTLSVAPVFARAIHNIHNSLSVSELFL
jgi:ribose-phosphate pyrophosphokinase